MTFGYKLSKLRRENNYTQEQLADILGVSRQAISKWESDAAYPETDKLIRISELFNCSLDYLLREQVESNPHLHTFQNQTGQEQTTNEHNTQTQASYEHNAENNSSTVKKGLHDKKSKTILWGMPLWHIGKNAKAVIAIGLNAKGIIAIGLKASGVISFGILSIGLFTSGLLSIGLLSSGLFSLGIFSAGCFSLGILSAGAISFGIISVGAVAIGDFSIGALSIGKYFAIGDNARAMIAIGDSQAAGTIYSKIGELSELSPQEANNIRELLDTHVPQYLAWAKEIIKLLL